MDMHRLTCFVTTVDAGTVTAAAQLLGIAQPAVSRQIAALERQLGVRLFARQRGRLVPTAAGRVLADQARDLRDHADRVDAAARNLAAGRPQRVMLASPEATITEVVAPFLATLTPDDPLVLVRECAATQAADELLDVADLVVTTSPPIRRLATRVLGAVPICATVTEDHRWVKAGHNTVELADLVAEPLILLTRDHMTRLAFDAAVSARGLTTTVVTESALESVVQGLAASGQGVGVQTRRPRFGLRALPVTDAGRGPLGISLHAAWPADHYAGRELRRLAERLEQVLASVLAGTG
jgi:DNA-binding transcriptional LysR family regulator